AAPAAHPPGTATPTSTPRTPDPPSTTPFPPSAPTNLTATQVRTTSVTLTWTAATPGCCAVAGYDIVYFNPFDDVVYSLSLGDVTTATVTSYIQPGRQYTFRVSARDSDNRRSPASDPATVVTPVTDTGPDTTPPSAPGNLTVGEVTDSTARLSWSPSTDDVGVLAYDVYRFDGWYTSTRVATVPGTTYTMSLPAPAPAPLRTLYYVRARDAVGNVSIASNTVTVPTTSTPPSTCRVTYRNQSEWPGGFVAAVTVQNTGTAPVDGWILTFGFPGDQQVTTAWNATVAQTGATVTARNADWNRHIAPNGSATFGFQGRWSASDAPPTVFSLNGAPCAVG
ncbi:cellulose binding domain-containing protein, partial [Micromonospora sp. NPDC005313]|uniref:cellulose binding domain-containing protein n=1 Tax=Micromonospora sp. NPDC005313 TaxID=3154296 RepID=UPI0033ACF249